MLGISESSSIRSARGLGRNVQRWKVNVVNASCRCSPRVSRPEPGSTGASGRFALDEREVREKLTGRLRRTLVLDPLQQHADGGLGDLFTAGIDGREAGQRILRLIQVVEAD